MGSNKDRPQDVGIVALEVYFPSEYVEQSDLEQFDNVSRGKYVIGLGQEKMGFCSDVEDINSVCLTVVNNLMDRLSLSYKEIGRLEVGTETILDKSKSVKSVLMQLFYDSNNHDVEGVDSTNACYGGTAALFNSIAWVESSAWDGRFALVVAGDIAVYATGNARCTGGAGAVALLIGPNAPVVLENDARASHMMNVYDFFKPNLACEYPTVDGQLSIKCYLQSLDNCFTRYLEKRNNATKQKCGLADFDAVIFHTPYSKLVQKSVARLSFIEFLQSSTPDKDLDIYRNLKLEETYFNKEVEKAFMVRSKDIFEKKTLPSLLLAKNVGNMYTASLYSCLASWIASSELDSLTDQRVGLFSFGSGSAATFFSLKLKDQADSSLANLHSSLKDLRVRLESRKKATAEDFTKKMEAREKVYNQPSYKPSSSEADLFPRTWYLTEVDELRRRKYSRKNMTAASS